MCGGAKYTDTPVSDVKPTEAAVAKLPQSASFSEQSPEDKHRSDWQANHLLIENAIMMLMHKLGRPASNLEIAKATGLSERAVRYHIENIDMPTLFSQVRLQYAPLADEIMMSVVKSARRGTGRAQELYFELVFGWKRGQTIEIEKPRRTEEEVRKLSESALIRYRSQVVALRNLSKEELYQQVQTSESALSVAHMISSFR